jgi:hypothetical protein
LALGATAMIRAELETARARLLAESNPDDAMRG